MKACLIFVLLLLLPISNTHALYDPLSVANNKYGIHITDNKDIPDAAFLVNSQGDWGYVTVVIQDNDRDIAKWQKVFDQMRRLRLIPIVRLGTHFDNQAWKKPLPQDAQAWAQFLHSLNWPIENRYIVLFNEPNHASEWGNSLNPEEYADVALSFINELKHISGDFFVLPAGLDASAPNGDKTMDSDTYLRRVFAKQPELLTKIDGWTSHSYPNPAFSGSPLATGKGTIRSFQWEIGLLDRLGVTKNLPIFITETGWQHHEGKVTNFSLLRAETIAQYIKTAAGGAWSDSRIVAITPFILNYQDVPFDHFSWRRFGGEGFYPHYFAYLELPKTSGEPKQRESYEMTSPLLPPILVGDSTTTITGRIRNVGQAIVDPGGGYALKLRDQSNSFSFFAEPVSLIEPKEEGALTAHVIAPKTEGVYSVTVVLTHGSMEVELQTIDINIVPPPSVTIKAKLAWRSSADVNDVTVLVYDHEEKIVHKFVGLSLAKGFIHMEGLKNIIPNREYRLVVLVPGYLPRQTYVVLSPELTLTSVKRLLPFDIDKDGNFSFEDVTTAFSVAPHEVWKLFFGS